MNDTMALNELADLFSILGNPDRLRILFELQNGPRDVASLVSTVGVSQSRTSQHLGLLKAHHLVLASRDGRGSSIRPPSFPEWVLQGFAHSHRANPRHPCKRVSMHFTPLFKVRFVTGYAQTSLDDRRA